MALRSKALHHKRSLSLPSKTNPATSQLDKNLSGLLGSEAASSSSLSSMRNRVNSLSNLYSSIDDLLLLPRIQHIVSEEKWADRVLDGYIGLLDACTTTKDLISSTKQGVQELLSALRRKDVAGVRRYLNSRKKSKKIIQKALRSKHNILASSTMSFVCKLKDAESMTIAMLESLLSYLIGTKMQSGWSLVTKLMHSKKNQDKNLNEFEEMDGFLHKYLEGIQVDQHMSLLKEVESSIQNLEEELECFFRQLIKTRVLLLNILNH